MSKEKWSEAKTKQFVLTYLNQPVLWNSGMPEYLQKTEKTRAYNELMSEFNLSLPEVRNKIRIFRTTYNQEKKKEETILNYRPKLSWYQDMKSAFDTGKIKSFVKTPGKIKVELDKQKAHAIHYEFEQEDHEEHENDERERSQIIIEPYEEYEVEEDEDQDIDMNKKDDSQHNNSSNQTLLTSNELFLQSLKSSLDKLPDEKNMRARIAIQETLYKIMYEK